MSTQGCHFILRSGGVTRAQTKMKTRDFWRCSRGDECEVRVDPDGRKVV